MDKKTVIVNGAAGFAGYSLTKELARQGYTVCAVLRPGSGHNSRVRSIPDVAAIELDAAQILKLPDMTDIRPDAFIHLVWTGGRYSIEDQKKNINCTMDALEAAHLLGCRRFVCTGSQAEYGATTEIQTESMTPDPFCAYGAAKMAAYYLTRFRAGEIGIEWIWGRIFSLYGLYEPEERMLPAVVKALKENRSFNLSSCRQNWDYLYVEDAAEAIIALMERGKPGEAYNIANGSYRVLREYIEEAKDYLGSKSELIYGNDPDPFVSLQPSISKIHNDTGWSPKTSFVEGIEKGYR